MKKLNNKLSEINKKKAEIINIVYNSKDSLTSNQLNEYLDELVDLCFHREQLKTFNEIVKENTTARNNDNYTLTELSESVEIYVEQIDDLYYNLHNKPLKQLKPLENLWREENSPNRFVIPDATKFYKWIRVKILGE